MKKLICQLKDGRPEVVSLPLLAACFLAGWTLAAALFILTHPAQSLHALSFR